MSEFYPRIVQIENISDAVRTIKQLGSSPDGRKIMTPKMVHYCVWVENLDNRAANILKQDMLSIGGETSLTRDAFSFKGEKNPAVISGTAAQFARLIEKMSYQPFGLKRLSEELSKIVAINRPSENRSFKAGGKEFDLFRKTVIMGVLNVTPDSFSDGGTFFKKESAVKHALRMAEEGADIIDIGGESTRPYSSGLSVEEELERVVPVLESISKPLKEKGVLISVDTCKSEVANMALEKGASIVNDVTSLSDPEMLGVISERGASVVLMHMKGTPSTMQDNPEYEDLIGEIDIFLRDKAAQCLDAGIEREKIAIDPGIGFGKTTGHNLEIIRRLREFESAGHAIAIGTSRKSFIGKILDRGVEERAFGTASSMALAVARGADIVRVHDVGEMAMACRVADAICGKGGFGED